MTFDNYLAESAETEEIDVDDFIKQIKSKGLFGYNVFKHITEEELRKIISDDEYFKKEKKTDKKELSEMTLPPKKETENQENQEEPTQTKLSLAVRLGLKKEIQKTTDNDKTNTPDKEHIFGKKDTPQKLPVLSFADRMRAEAERRNQDRIMQQKKDQELRDQKLKQSENEATTFENPTFANKTMDSQKQVDNKSMDKKNDDIDKQLTNAMFKKETVKVSDNNGYKKVDNLSQVDDKESNSNLKKEMDDKFPGKDKESENSDKTVSKQTNVEYSKRTLLAISDRMDFDVYAKFRKADGQIRTGNFRIGNSDAQVTEKQTSITVIDNDLTTDPKKPAWRTIPLTRLIEIKPQ